jgi:WD40 repeat protein/tRNA A-37 threonylcarbamoyl transferase component Bud32
MSDEKPTRPDSHASASASDSSGLKGLTTALGIGPADPGHDVLLGSDIGGVKIVRLIAEGGMGRVYEGKQDRPNRTVAVKVMRPGLTSPSILKRFEYEAEVLGRLQHPGIAHVYSVGMHRVGNASVPYFVMEYIADAKTLTHYAKDLKLPTRQRLDLFRSVCDAVAHGHQKGVIHRDLKPSNILVDVTGQPKVIDFGVARATDSDMAVSTMQTDVGQLLGTLQYMSPEQFDANPNDIDIRSDVYALGVVLYELLAEKPPYDVKKKAIFEVARIVKEEDPTPLSTFNRALKGDVAVIAGKCLEKDRSRRYSSASDLGADIGRYLTGEPIAANPPGFLDGLARLARKHRAAAAAVAGVFAALVIALIGIGFFASHAEEARRLAEMAQENAEQARSEAEERRNESERARVAADRERQQAVIERDRANAAESRLKTKLIDSNIYEIDKLLTDSPTLAGGPPERKLSENRARSLLSQTIAFFEQSEVPLPLACLASEFDGEDNGLMGHMSPTVCASLAPDCKQVTTGHMDGTIRIWTVPADGKKPLTLRGAKHPIGQVLFSGDGRRVMAMEFTSPAAGQKASIWIWDSATGAEVAVLKDDQVSAEFRKNGSAAISRDGNLLAVCQLGGIHLWDVAAKNRVRSFQCTDLNKSMQALAWVQSFPVFSPDDSRLAGWLSTGGTSMLCMWDVATGKELFVVPLFDQAHSPPAFNSEGTMIAVPMSKSIDVIDASSGKKQAALVHYANGESIAFSPDGSKIASGGANGFTVLDTATGAKVLRAMTTTEEFHFGASGLRFRGNQRPVAFSPDGSRVVAWKHSGRIRSVDLRSHDVRTELTGLTGAILSVAFSFDGSLLATGSLDNTIRLWNTASGEEIVSLEGHREQVSSVAFSPNGEQLASGSWDGSVRLWDLSTGLEARTLVTDAPRVSSIAFSPDGAQLACGFHDGRARILQIDSGKEKMVLKAADIANAEVQTFVSFSQNGRYLATAAGSITQVWHAASGEHILELKKGGKAITFSPDSTRLVTLGEHFHVWEVPGGRELSPPSDLPRAFFGGAAVAFSSDSGHIAVCHSKIDQPRGARVRFIRTDSMACAAGISYGGSASSHAGDVTCLAISPKGTQLATGSKDGTARLWGRTSAEIRNARAEVQVIRRRLQPKVDSWFAQESKTAVQMLRDSKPELTSHEYHEAANMVLKRCVAERSDQP